MLPEHIQTTTSVEDLVEAYPQVVSYLIERHGIRVICCGSPVWATLEQVARPKGIEPNVLVAGLREFLGG